MTQSKIQIGYINPQSYSNLSKYDSYLLESILSQDLNIKIYYFCSSLLDINPNPSIVARKVFKYQQYSNRISSVLSYCFSSVQVVYSCTRQSINILHFQWPKLPPFDCLLIFLLKLLGKKIVYTLHNVIPHDTSHLSFFDLIILRLVITFLFIVNMLSPYC